MDYKGFLDAAFLEQNIRMYVKKLLLFCFKLIFVIIYGPCFKAHQILNLMYPILTPCEFFILRHISSPYFELEDSKLQAYIEGIEPSFVAPYADISFLGWFPSQNDG